MSIYSEKHRPSFEDLFNDIIFQNPTFCICLIQITNAISDVPLFIEKKNCNILTVTVLTLLDSTELVRLAAALHMCLHETF